VNADELAVRLVWAQRRVLKIQAKLHGWAFGDCDQRFDDVFNLVTDPAFLLVAWDRVAGNQGARTAGVDGRTAPSVAAGVGVQVFLDDLRDQVRAGQFRPLPVRERLIPKPAGGRRRLGIPTVADRVVQASLKLVLEPIFEADFLPCSYGFRPNRRAHDAVAEVRYLASRPRRYEWVLEGDIKACFDEIDHTALMDLVRRRVGDKRVLGLVKAFLKAGIMTEAAEFQESTAGTPQGGILSPLLANVGFDCARRARRRPSGRAARDRRPAISASSAGPAKCALGPVRRRLVSDGQGRTSRCR
jgi:RNA-directed DNA polymerase